MSEGKAALLGLKIPRVAAHPIMGLSGRAARAAGGPHTPRGPDFGWFFCVDKVAMLWRVVWANAGTRGE